MTEDGVGWEGALILLIATYGTIIYRWTPWKVAGYPEKTMCHTRESTTKPSWRLDVLKRSGAEQQ